jgi:uncharacterized protein YndB with AHSA1/START domain
MSVTSVEKDPEALTMTVTADLDATVERAWQLWADPRQFERWWSPPGYPATVVDHDLRAGGRITFFMTGTDGDRHDSTWEVLAADPPTQSLARYSRQQMSPDASERRLFQTVSAVSS